MENVKNNDMYLVGQLEMVHSAMTKIFERPAGMHGEKWRYRMVKHYWTSHCRLLDTWPTNLPVPTLPIQGEVIEYLDMMERVDP